MQYHNTSDQARQTVIEFKVALTKLRQDDEAFFNLWEYEIDALLKAGLIEPEPARGWFSRIFGRGIQYRVTRGFPNVIIYKRERIAYGKMV